MQRSRASSAFLGLVLLCGTSHAQSRNVGGAVDRAGGGAGGAMIGRGTDVSGGAGGAGGAAGGAGGATGDGGATFGAGNIAGQMTDPSSVFGVQRGNTVGGAAETVEGFSSVGADATGAMGATGGAMRGGGALGGAFGGMGGLGGLFGGSNPFGTGAGSEQQPQAVRTRLRSGIQVAPVPPQQVQAQVQQNLYGTPAAARFQGTQVRMDGRTAVLTGQVRSEEDRRMAELLMRLEPGVSRIENKLSVGQPEIVPSPSDTMTLPQP